MVTSEHWAQAAVRLIEQHRIEHARYVQTRNRIISSVSAIWPGEGVILVGPSRVGKTRCISDALDIAPRNVPDPNGHMRCVLVEAENSGKNGEFSTKAFMIACLRAIHHPIYGNSAPNDQWGNQQHTLLHRTSESSLRDAFELALAIRRTELLVVDEGHHVQYVPGGESAAIRVLDSWKCLANKTKVKLVLSGAYSLLPIMSLAPHLIGRQQVLDFGRYRRTREDVRHWERVLREYSGLLRFAKGESLSTWNRILFEGSLGCFGLLSQWLRACLSLILTSGESCVTLPLLHQTRLPDLHRRDLLAEIEIGEEYLLRSPSLDADAPAPPSKTPKVALKRQRPPFQRKSRRNAVEGRN